MAGPLKYERDGIKMEEIAKQESKKCKECMREYLSYSEFPCVICIHNAVTKREDYFLPLRKKRLSHEPPASANAESRGMNEV